MAAGRAGAGGKFFHARLRYPAPPSLPPDPRSAMDFLRELGLQKDNSGAYDGEWLACKGEWLESKDPATGRVMGRVRQATGEEY